MFRCRKRDEIALNPSHGSPQYWSFPSKPPPDLTDGLALILRADWLYPYEDLLIGIRIDCPRLLLRQVEEIDDQSPFEFSAEHISSVNDAADAWAEFGGVVPIEPVAHHLYALTADATVCLQWL